VRAEGNNVAIRVRVDFHVKRNICQEVTHLPPLTDARLPQLSTFCDCDCHSNATEPTDATVDPRCNLFTLHLNHPPGPTPTPTPNTTTTNHSSVTRQSHTPASAHHNGRQLPPRWRRRRRWQQRPQPLPRLRIRQTARPQLSRVSAIRSIPPASSAELLRFAPAAGHLLLPPSGTATLVVP
jgi:hypothetical protein